MVLIPGPFPAIRPHRPTRGRGSAASVSGQNKRQRLGCQRLPHSIQTFVLCDLFYHCPTTLAHQTRPSRSTQPQGAHPIDVLMIKKNYRCAPARNPHFLPPPKPAFQASWPVCARPLNPDRHNCIESKKCTSTHLINT
eukprot:scaffold159538_cov18-Tisochrysis_lutea.AAC.2